MLPGSRFRPREMLTVAITATPRGDMKVSAWLGAAGLLLFLAATQVGCYADKRRVDQTNPLDVTWDLNGAAPTAATCSATGAAALHLVLVRTGPSPVETEIGTWPCTDGKVSPSFTYDNQLDYDIRAELLSVDGGVVTSQVLPFAKDSAVELAYHFTSVATGTGTLRLDWTVLGDMAECLDRTVALVIGGRPPVTVPCAAGTSATTPLALGTYQIHATLLEPNGSVSAVAAPAPAKVRSGQETRVGFDFTALQPGSAHVTWTFADTGGNCSPSAGEVEVSFGRAGGFGAPTRLPCAPGEHLFPIVDASVYTVRLTPIASGSCVQTSGGTCLAVDKAPVRVLSAGRTEVPITVPALPVLAPLSVSWTLDGIAPSPRVCSALEATVVRVALVDASGAVAGNQNFTCGDGSGDFAGVPRGTYHLVADVALATGGFVAGQTTPDFTFDPANPGPPHLLALAPVNPGVVGSITVTWRINGTAPPPCAAVGAAYVLLSLPAVQVEFPCDAGGGTIPALGPGEYQPTGILYDGARTTLDSNGSATATVPAGGSVPLALDFAAPVGGTVESVQVTATPASLTVGRLSVLGVTVSGRGNFSTAVTWSAWPAGGSLGLPGVGATFNAPSPGDYTVTATSVQDPSFSGSTVVHVTPGACQPTPQVVFQDQDFVQAGWTDGLADGTTPGISAAAHAEQRTTGGNPDAYRRVTNHLAGVGILLHQNVKLAAVHDPVAHGAIDTIDASFDLLGVDGVAANAYFLALLQDGRMYRSIQGHVAPPSAWTTVTYQGLGPADFVLVNGSAPGPLDLDSGGPVAFGYLVAISNTSPGAVVDHQSGLDNFQVTVSCK